LARVNCSIGKDRPTLAEISRSALRDNYAALKALVGKPEIMAVIKADAYGHGAVEVARVLCAEGCRHLGVATVREASALRAADIDARIYLMGGFFDEQATDIIDLQLIPFIFDQSAIVSLEQAARARRCMNFPVHLKLDTGATRLGIRFEQLDATIAELRRASRLRLEGVCTLLADAGNPASSATSEQLELFRREIAKLEQAGLRPELIHAANSAAAVLRPDSHFNLVRIGLALYGLAPTPAVQARIFLQPVMTFKTRLLQLKYVPAGTRVSYGGTFVTSRPSLIGILPVGYADGYRRGLQHGAEVMIGGQRAPVVGAICMDLTMIDLTDVPRAAVGDEVILWGGSKEDMISVNEIARLAQTISYEMLSTVGKRVPRVYVG
jgi:alanine racemase